MNTKDLHVLLSLVRGTQSTTGEYSCPLFDAICPTSPWSSSTFVSGDDAMYNMCAQIVSSHYMAKVLIVASFF